MYRSDTYDQDLKRRMKNPIFAQEFILALIDDEDEPMTVEEALRFTIQRMGTTDFAELVGDLVQSVDKFLKGNRKLKPETLDRYLRPFGLKTKISLERVRPISA
jgi:hypothetical protein